MPQTFGLILVTVSFLPTQQSDHSSLNSRIRCCSSLDHEKHFRWLSGKIPVSEILRPAFLEPKTMSHSSSLKPLLYGQFELE